jgi:hypothetical protein
MNKKLIKKYFNEFTHWLNGGSILARTKTSYRDNFVYSIWFNDFAYTIWHEVDSNESDSLKSEYLFNLTDKQVEYYKPQLIINDEYIEFRKALADNKTIQYYIDSFKGWKDVTTVGDHCFIGTKNYRIKPEEPKFKIGDFVTPLNREINCSIWKIDKIVDCNVVSGNTILDIKQLKLWHPKPNEWCFFWDRSADNIASLSKFKEMYKDKFKSVNCTWKYCAPFIGELPAHLKD